MFLVKLEHTSAPSKGALVAEAARAEGKEATAAQEVWAAEEVRAG